MILSLRDVLDGASGELIGSVVIHECAHKLDQLNGSVNGFPPLHPGMSPSAWTAAWQQAYDDLLHRVDAARRRRSTPTPSRSPASSSRYCRSISSRSRCWCGTSTPRCTGSCGCSTGRIRRRGRCRSIPNSGPRCDNG